MLNYTDNFEEIRRYALSEVVINRVTIVNDKDEKKRKNKSKPNKTKKKKIIQDIEYDKSYKVTMFYLISFSFFYQKNHKFYNVPKQLKMNILKKANQNVKYETVKCLPKYARHMLFVPKVAKLKKEDIPNVFYYKDLTPKQYYDKCVERSSVEDLKKLDWSSFRGIKEDHKLFGEEQLWQWGDAECNEFDICAMSPGAEYILLSRGYNKS